MPCHLSEGWRRMGATVHEFLYGTHMGKSWIRAGLEANRVVNRDLLQTARRLKGEGRLDLIFAVIYDDVLEVETAQRLRALGVPMVNYHVDLVGQWYRVLRIGAYFDRVACAQEDHWSGLQRAGIRPYYMPMAANPLPHPPPTTWDDLRFDGVTYMGSPWSYRRATLSSVSAAGIPLRVYGRNWRAERESASLDPSKAQPLRKNLHDGAHYLFPRLREEGAGELLRSIQGRIVGRNDFANDRILDCCLMGAYRNDDFISIVRGSAINLGFTHFRGTPATRTERRQVRLREFEIPMAGGFYLTQDCAQLRELFDINSDVASWDQLPDLLEKIRYYLARPEERQQISAAGQARCLARHTWQQRFSGLLDDLGVRLQ